MSRGEEWRPVVGHEGNYSVSNLGKVRSDDRMVRCNSGFRRVRERILCFGLHKNGYLQVNLSSGKSIKRRLVHQLVAEAFLGPRPSGVHTCHNDGNPKNNIASNIRYDTCKGNFSDKVKHGTSLHGHSMNAKHSEELVREIKSALGSQKEIANRFGVSQGYVSNIRSGKIRGGVF